MTIQTIGIGSGANNGTGDPLRTAMDKINQNFSQCALAADTRVLTTTSSSLPIVGYKAISTSSSTNALHMAQAASGASAGLVVMSNTGSVMGAISIIDSGTPDWIISTGVAYTERVRVSAASGNVSAGADNSQTMGIASKRWSVVYAGTGTINTSDAREKTVVASMTAAEIAAAKDLAREIGTYQFLASVAEKGADNARRHAGMTVQRAIEVMQSHGLDPFRYGFICHDSWEDEFIDHPAIVADEENGIEAKAAWREQVQTAGDRYAFRPDELLFFVARGLEARLTALEGA